MVQLEQYEPTALASTEADPNVEVNVTKQILMPCVFSSWFATLNFSGLDSVLFVRLF